jgi:hypothetical protein
MWNGTGRQPKLRGLSNDVSALKGVVGGGADDKAWTDLQVIREGGSGQAQENIAGRVAGGKSVASQPLDF